MSRINIVSYNCRSIKSTAPNVNKLCDSHDICLLQEHWLLNEDLDYLSSIHKDFHAYGVSAVDTGSGLLSGRPYGGTAILWRKSFGDSIRVKSFNDARLLGAELILGGNKLFILCVYLPTNCSDNFDEFSDYLGKINAIVQEQKSSNIFILGDWNADMKSRFGKELKELCDTTELVLADIEYIGQSDNNFTYISDAHHTTSWLDHCVSTVNAHHSIVDINILYDHMASDHLPLSVTCQIDKLINMEDSTPNQDSTTHTSVNWSEVGTVKLAKYSELTERYLKTIDILVDAINCGLHNCTCDDHNNNMISCYYDDIVDALKKLPMSHSELNSVTNTIRFQDGMT